MKRKGQVRFVFITGLSGSGKSLAMRALEDSGFFCVDNLPPKLVVPFADLTAKGGEKIDRVAIVADIRERGFLKDFPSVYRLLQERGFHTTLLFLDARDDVLVRRFNESRRPHPLAVGRGGVRDAVRAERRKLAPIRKLADQILDTSSMNVHQLRRYLLDHFAEPGTLRGPVMNIVSFGYKHGLPPDADLVFDVRFLANPYFERKLRDRSGSDPQVVRFMKSFPVTGEFLDRLKSFLGYLVPRYTAEGKSYLTIAVGCTGGQHRSVMVANTLGRFLREQGHPVKVTHRDVEGEP